MRSEVVRVERGTSIYLKVLSKRRGRGITLKVRDRIGINYEQNASCYLIVNNTDQPELDMKTEWI